MLMKEIGDDANRKKYYVLGLKNQYCQNDCITQGDLQIQCNSYQIINGIFQRTTKKKFLKFVWKHKRPLIIKVILTKKIELEESGSMTSHYTVNLQSSKQYGTGTKTEI